MARIEELKSENIQKVRRCLYSSRRPWTRPELCRETGLSMGGASNILKLLLERGEILYTGNAPSAGGRKSKLYELAPDYVHIGVLLLAHGERQFSVTAASLNLRSECVFHSRRLAGDAEAGGTGVAGTENSEAEIGRKEVHNERTGRTEESYSCSAQAVFSAAQEMILADPLLRCLVVSFPGIVASDGLIKTSDFPGLAGLNLKERLEKLISARVPVLVENDVNLAAVGYGKRHEDCENLAVLYQPDQDPAGVGILIRGRLYSGTQGFAGEIGWLDREGQLRLLRENPEELVRKQLTAITCTLAPERIAWYCPLVNRNTDLRESLQDKNRNRNRNGSEGQYSIPEDFLPKLERLGDMKDMEELIRLGAETAGRENICSRISV